ncbi:MAG: hypothetical protein EPO36_13275 [Chloroflexota bacterium]|nr:MAG: hypothetical protein EPO36_13275 [Chloroflexota bacterium]
MRRFVLFAVAALMVATLAVGTVAASGNLWKAPPFASIGIHNVYYIGTDFDVDPDPENAILRVWMETGSASEKCLVTMGEANHAPAVDQIYCSSRGVTLDDGQVLWGVYVTLMLGGEPIDVDGDPSWYSLNVYQEGARFFGDPFRVECDDTHCFAF